MNKLYRPLVTIEMSLIVISGGYFYCPDKMYFRVSTCKGVPVLYDYSSSFP